MIRSSARVDIGTQEISFEALSLSSEMLMWPSNACAGHYDLSRSAFNLRKGAYSVGGDIARVEQSIQHASNVCGSCRTI